MSTAEDTITMTRRVTATNNGNGVPRHCDGSRYRREVAINCNGEEMQQSTEDKGQRRWMRRRKDE